ncbi:Uncharacterised protein [Mycobacteroides abscessus]|nr:Uncharacterised protein [Mycobacteroides abscessus]
MRAEDLPESFVAALVEQVQVHFAQSGQKPVGVGDDERCAAVFDVEAIVQEIQEGQRHGEQPRAKVRHVMNRVTDHRRNGTGARFERANDGISLALRAWVLVRAQD